MLPLTNDMIRQDMFEHRAHHMEGRHLIHGVYHGHARTRHNDQRVRYREWCRDGLHDTKSWPGRCRCQG